jgi:hypothetical protein
MSRRKIHAADEAAVAVERRDLDCDAAAFDHPQGDFLRGARPSSRARSVR